MYTAYNFVFEVINLFISVLKVLFLNKDVWINVWANFLAIGGGYIFIVFFKKRNLIKFFGFDKQKKLSIFLSTLYIPSMASFTHAGLRMRYEGAAIPEYEHQVIPIFSNLFSLITTGDGIFKTMANRFLLGDVDIDYLNAPKDFNKISFHNFICVGGPSANQVTNHYMSSEFAYLGFNSVTSGVEIKKGKGKGRQLGLSNQHDDYGIVEKIIDKKNNSIVFITAGGNIGATKGCAFYLAKNWRSLQRRYGSKGFAICIKVPQHFVDPQGYANAQVVFQTAKK